jgi:ribosomal protein S18 acetylase RimI-like enzyme
MMMNEIIYRDAREEDSRRIAELDNIASEGALDFLFHDLVTGMTPVQMVADGLENDRYPHSYRSVIVAEHGNNVVGMSLSFPSRYHAITDELRSFLPPDRLEHFRDFFSSRVEDSYFLDALSVDERYRNRGIGRELINLTAKRARKEGFKVLSLISFADNTRALRLYRKFGFTVVKHIDLKPHKYIQHEGGCLLMKYDIKGE